MKYKHKKEGLQYKLAVNRCVEGNTYSRSLKPGKRQQPPDRTMLLYRWTCISDTQQTSNTDTSLLSQPHHRGTETVRVTPLRKTLASCP